MNNALPMLEKEFEVRNNKKYKIKVIINSAVYSNKAENSLPGLYYLDL